MSTRAKASISRSAPIDVPTPSRRNVCPEIGSAFGCLSWLSDPQAPIQAEKVEETISKFSRHAISYCKCTSPSTCYFAAACCEYQLFLLESESNTDQVIDEEIRCCVALVDSREDKSETDQHLFVTSKDMSSKLDGSVLSHIVNWDRQKHLLKHIDNVLTFIESGCESKVKFLKDDIRKYRIQDILRTGFYVYQLHRIVVNQHRCASLINKLSCSSSDTLRSFYFNTLLALQVGDIEMAAKYRDEGKIFDVLPNTPTSLNMDSSLFFYSSIEVDLRQGIDVGKPLKSFLNAEAIQKVTVNRYFLKAIGLLIASKLPGDFSFDHDNLSKEFYEPHQMALYMVKRWNKKLVDQRCQVRVNDDELLDPIWLRYAVYNLYLDSYLTISSFYCKTGTPTELTFLHEAVIRLCREKCLLYWLRKILIIAADIDVLTDKSEFAHYKLTNALDLIDHETSHNYFNAKNRKILVSKENTEDTEDITYKLTSVNLDKYSSAGGGDEEECLHNRPKSSWELRRIAMKQTPGMSPEEYLKTRDYCSLEPIECDIFGTDLDRLEAIMKLILVKNKTPYDIISKLNRMTFGTNLKNSYKLALAVRKLSQRKMTSERAKTFSHEVSTFLSLKPRALRTLWMLENGLRCMDVTKVIEVSKLLFEKSYNQRMDLVEGYVSRMLFAELSLFMALSLNFSGTRLTQFSPSETLMEWSKVKVIPAKESAPSPPRTKTRMQPPRAPKRQPYKMEEFNEYLQKLGHDARDEVVRDCEGITLAERYKKILDEISQSDASFQREETSETSSKSGRKVSKSVSQNKPTKREPTKSLRDVQDDVFSTDILLFKNFARLTPDPSLVLFSLEYLMKYIGNHPPTDFYRRVNQLFVKLCLEDSICNLKKAAYHFGELASTSLRYRFMRTVTKRQKVGKIIKHSLDEILFNPKVGSADVQHVLDECPDGWRILQLEFLETRVEAKTGRKSPPDLMISRFEKGSDPLFFTVKSGGDVYLKNFMSELKEIVELSNASTRERDPQSFWRVRMALDTRMGTLLKSFETAWLGPFKGLFLGSVQNKSFIEATRTARKAVMKIAENNSIATVADQELLKVIIESFSVLNEDEFKSGIGFLFKSFEHSFLNQAWEITSQVLSQHSNAFFRYPVGPIGLVLGQGLEQFPWESLPIARTTKQEIFRTPSLRFLHSSLISSKLDGNIADGIDSKSTFFLVNPTANLPRTEEKFKGKMERQEGWTGVTGRIPKVEEFVGGLESNDVYLYFGHGAGTDYCKLVKDNLEGVDIRTASLVIGCSSGRLRNDGMALEPFGPAYKFISNGAPCFVGNLWDVTDRDIDLLSDQMLGNWMPNWKPDEPGSSRRTTKKGEKAGVSICRAIADAREAVKLKYLIGAATVVYGLPVRIGTPS